MKSITTFCMEQGLVPDADVSNAIHYDLQVAIVIAASRKTTLS